MDQIRDILNALQGYGEQPTQALNGTIDNSLQPMVAAFQDCFTHGQMASQHLAQLMTNPVVVSLFIGVALGRMISQMVKDNWKNNGQHQSE